MRTALKLMRVAEQALIDADRRMKPSMEADNVNVPLHRSAECLMFAIAAAETYIAEQGKPAHIPQRAD
jgi:hypothetical protein